MRVEKLIEILKGYNPYLEVQLRVDYNHHEIVMVEPTRVDVELCDGNVSQKEIIELVAEFEWMKKHEAE